MASTEFQARVREAEDTVVSQVSMQLTGLAPQAVTMLSTLMSDSEVSDPVRLRACLGVLAASRRWRELEDTEVRLRELENEIAEINAERAQ